MQVIHSGNYVTQTRCQKPQKVQGPRCMPHFSVADIQISLLFEGNIIFCPGTTNSFLWAALSLTVSSSFEWRLPELSPFKWPILIRIMSKPSQKLILRLALILQIPPNKRQRHCITAKIISIWLQIYITLFRLHASINRPMTLNNAIPFISSLTYQSIVNCINLQRPQEYHGQNISLSHPHLWPYIPLTYQSIVRDLEKPTTTKGISIRNSKRWCPIGPS